MIKIFRMQGKSREDRKSERCNDDAQELGLSVKNLIEENGLCSCSFLAGSRVRVAAEVDARTSTTGEVSLRCVRQIKVRMEAGRSR